MSSALLMLTPPSGVPLLKVLAIYIGNTPLMVGDLLNHYLLWLLFVLPPGHPILAQGDHMSNYTVQMLSVASMVLSPDARDIDEGHAKKIARTVPVNGDILQGIGVIQLADGTYRVVWGGHRLRAYKILGRTEIPARILPPETTPADEAKYSLVENAVRKNETFEEKLARVENLALAEGVSIDEARELSEISKGEFNRCQTIGKKLTPNARRFANKHKDKIGNSDLYLVASKAPTEQKQLEALQARVNGKTRNELASWLGVQKKPASKTKAPRKPRQHRHLGHTAGETKITVTAGRTCGQVAADLQPYLKQLLANPALPISEFALA